MADKKRGWRNPVKFVKPTTDGKCPFCKLSVKSLEKHIHDKHKGEKGAKKKIEELTFASKRTRGE